MFRILKVLNSKIYFIFGQLINRSTSGIMAKKNVSKAKKAAITREFIEAYYKTKANTSSSKFEVRVGDKKYSVRQLG